MNSTSKKKLTRWSCKTPLYVDKTDKRYGKYAKQLKQDGFSDTETWSMDVVFAEFILPRLKRFKEITNAYPGGDMSEKLWDETLGKMIFAFYWIINYEKDSEEGDFTELQIKKNWDTCQDGLNLFAKWFNHLGW